MKKITKLLIFLFMFLILITPALSFATLVTCDNSATQPCDFNALMGMINGIINFILYSMVIPIAAILFAFVGFEMVTSGGSSEKRGLAKKVFANVVIGLIIAMSCWLVVKLILGILGYNGAWIGF